MATQRTGTAATPTHKAGTALEAKKLKHLSCILAILVVISFIINALGLRWPTSIGDSMSPTIRDGQRCLYLKPWRALRANDIVLFMGPHGESSKRIMTIEKGKLWLKGDNAEASVDSDMYGWVERDRVFGLMLCRLPGVFDGPTEAEAVAQGKRKKDSLKEKFEGPIELQSETFAADLAHVQKTSVPVYDIKMILMAKHESCRIDFAQQGIRRPTAIVVEWIGSPARLLCDGKERVLFCTEKKATTLIPAKGVNSVEFSLTSTTGRIILGLTVYGSKVANTDRRE